MSALPPKADMCSALAHVCFGPIADIRRNWNEIQDLAFRSTSVRNNNLRAMGLSSCGDK
jgi:hypothetical protein